MINIFDENLVLKNIEIEGFKAFSSKQKIPIRPITLIYGANSAGKSSILHGLMYLNEISKEKFNVNKIKLTHGEIDLGGLEAILHSSDKNNEITGIGLSACIGDFKLVLELAIEKTENLFSSYKAYYSKVIVERFDKVFFEYHSDESEEAMSFDWIQIAQYFSSRSSISQETVEFIDQQIKKINCYINKPYDIKVDISPVVFEARKIQGNTSITQEERSDRLWNECAFLKKALDWFFNSLKNEFDTFYNGLIYLGPFREFVRRNTLIMEQSHPQEKDNCWGMFYRSIASQNAINGWLNKKKKYLPYSIRISKYYDAEPVSELLTLLFKKLSNPESITNEENNSIMTYLEDFNEINEMLGETDDSFVMENVNNENSTNKSMKNFLKHRLDFSAYGLKKTFFEIMSKNLKNTHHSVNIVDVNTNRICSMEDLGVGVSQILPIILYCLSYELEYSQIFIEEPEIHLHPALQSELGDLFIEAYKEQNKKLIIETHSEHILLRIMRRIRETTNNTLPEGANGITPDDIAVLFVENNGDHSVVKHINLDEEGNLLDPWPGGFFEEGFNEMFS